MESLGLVDWGMFAYLAIIYAIFVQSNGRAGEDGLTDSIQPGDGRDARWHESPWNWLSCNVNTMRYWGNMRSLHTSLEPVFKISSWYLILVWWGRDGKGILLKIYSICRAFFILFIRFSIQIWLTWKFSKIFSVCRLASTLHLKLLRVSFIGNSSFVFYVMTYWAL